MVGRSGVVMACAVVVMSGCASIVDGTNQVVSVDTRKNGVPVTGANCKLTNDKGTWYSNTPGTTVVRRSYQDLNVHCQKAGLAPAITAFKSSTKGMAFGNIIFGGVIGAGIDMASGSAYDYPTALTVEMADLVDLSRVQQAPHLQVAATTPPGQQNSDKIEAERASLTLALAGCQSIALPYKFKQKDETSYYEARCSDMRLVHTVCAQGDCRLRTAND